MAKKEKENFSFLKEKEAARERWLRFIGSTKPRGGLWLRQWRSQRNMSQLDLARALGLSTRTIIRWEQLDELPLVIVLALEGK